VIDGVVAPLVGGDHAPVKPQDLIQFTPVETNRLIQALAPRLQRDQYCGSVPIPRTAAVIGHARSFM
jgi:hypothetical protein